MDRICKLVQAGCVTETSLSTITSHNNWCVYVCVRERDDYERQIRMRHFYGRKIASICAGQTFIERSHGCVTVARATEPNPNSCDGHTHTFTHQHTRWDWSQRVTRQHVKTRRAEWKALSEKHSSGSKEKTNRHGCLIKKQQKTKRTPKITTQPYKSPHTTERDWCNLQLDLFLFPCSYKRQKGFGTPRWIKPCGVIPHV